MKRALLAATMIAVAAFGARFVEAKQKSIAGTWTLTAEHINLKLVFAQKKHTVTGTLDYPHGDPIKLSGSLNGDTLLFSGDSKGENFTVHVDSTASVNADGTLAGTLKAHLVDFNDAHEIVRQHDDVIPWTAVRGLHDVMHFPRDTPSR